MGGRNQPPPGRLGGGGLGFAKVVGLIYEKWVRMNVLDLPAPQAEVPKAESAKTGFFFRAWWWFQSLVGDLLPPWSAWVGF